MTKAIKALVVAIFIITGCDPHSGHSHKDEQDAIDQTHTDRGEKESYTMFSERLELFVEYDPIVVGEESKFTIHFTDLKNDYSPLVKADVLLSLEIDREVNKSYQAISTQPGIYIVEKVSPNFSGEGLIIISVSFGEITEEFEIEHVHIFKDLQGIHSHGTEGVSGEVIFTKEQAWTIDFDVERVTTSVFSKVINTSGEILAMPGEKQNLVAKHDGVVMFSTRNLVQGSHVTKGNLLFTVSSKGFADDNIAVQFQKARLEFEKSKSQFLRHKELVKEKIVSHSQFVASQNQYEADSISYFYLKKNVFDGGLNVYAPLTGYIHELNVSEGQYVSTGTIIATISSNKVMLLRADVPQQYFGSIGQIGDATFRPGYSQKVYTISELDGKLLAKASSVAENNHYMPVYFEVNNDGTLLEGAFAEFQLKTNPETGKLLVPISALIEEQNNYYVYVQLSGKTYLKKQVSVGSSDKIQAEILSGITVGDRVVTKGAILLKAASVSSAPIHSHSH